MQFQSMDDVKNWYNESGLEKLDHQIELKIDELIEFVYKKAKNPAQAEAAFWEFIISKGGNPEDYA
ncbi:MAG: hypothetical protein HQK77_21820 [Desulfobacterales bacterium]|nr:hypothetical protein [Desulfobacterales bacterium]